MFSNLFYFLRLLFAASPALVIGELAWGVLTVLPGQLVSVLGVKYVIDIVTSGRDLKRLYAVVAGVVALIVNYLIVLKKEERAIGSSFGMCKGRKPITG